MYDHTFHCSTYIKIINSNQLFITETDGVPFLYKLKLTRFLQYNQNME